MKRKQSKPQATKEAKETLARVRARKDKLPPVGTTRPGGKPNDVSWHQAFIQVLLKTANVAQACRIAKVSRKTAYAHKEKFPDFAEAWLEAEETGLDDLYGEAFRRAFHGANKPVYQQGVKVGEICEYDNRLLMWLLERKRPEIFGDKSKVELSGKIDLTDEEIVERGRAAEKGVLAAMMASLRNKMDHQE